MGIDKMGNQQGFSLIKLIFLTGIAVIVLFSLIKVMPVYTEHHHFKKMLEEVSNDQSLVGASPKKVMESLSRQASLNHIVYDADTVDLSYDSERHPLLNAVYDKDIPLLGNVKLELHFETSPSASTLDNYNPLVGATASKDAANAAIKAQTNALNQQ